MLWEELVCWTVCVQCPCVLPPWLAPDCLLCYCSPSVSLVVRWFCIALRVEAQRRGPESTRALHCLYEQRNAHSALESTLTAPPHNPKRTNVDKTSINKSRNDNKKRICHSLKVVCEETLKSHKRFVFDRNQELLLTGPVSLEQPI
jgi:hypothetical protein